MAEKKQAFVMLAHVFNPKRHRIAGQYMSEKLDGFRLIWDGGITRGMPASEVPWANTEKHGRFKTPPVATGLWTRYAQPVQAPAWFLDSLPKIILDGEGWCGRGQWNRISSIIRTCVNTDQVDWTGMKFHVFDAPSVWQMFGDRIISDTNIKLNMVNCAEWAIERAADSSVLDIWKHGSWHFEATLGFLDSASPCFGPNVCVHQQIRLSNKPDEAEQQLSDYSQLVVDGGGEGVMIRYASSSWESERSWNLLKVKPENDMEGTVCGYVWGEQTDKGSKLLGLMGSMIVEIDTIGKQRFNLSGFTNEERILTVHQKDWDKIGVLSLDKARSVASEYGKRNPGKEVPDWIHSDLFPVGSRVSFKYRELTPDGKPKEAKYWRRA